VSNHASSLETLVTGHGLIEGPRVDAENRLYFSDVRHGGVYCRKPDGEIEVAVPKRRGVGGIAVHADGGIVVSGRNVCHVRNGSSRIVFDPDDVPSFNDLFVDSEGRILVGSQRFDPFDREAEAPPGELYRVEAEGRGTRLYGDVGLANGIGLSPDGNRLYHCDSGRNEVLAHDLTPAGGVANRCVFAKMPHGVPDGLAVDEAGCVWVAAFGGGCATRFTPEGEVDGHLQVPARNVASLCFGGPDRRDLYVVTGDNLEDASLGGSIFRTRVEVPGLPVPLARV
jgi:gluconolactonase